MWLKFTSSRGGGRRGGLQSLLQAHNQAETALNRLHLTAAQAGDSLSEHGAINGQHLGSIYDRIPIESGIT